MHELVRIENAFLNWRSIQSFQSFCLRLLYRNLRLRSVFLSLGKQENFNKLQFLLNCYENEKVDTFTQKLL